MKTVIGCVALLALIGCTADGKPSQSVGSALDSFSRAFNAGKTAPAPQPYQLPVQPMVAQPFQPAGVTAAWTGQSRHVQTVSGGMAWECIYDYAGKKYALLFDGFCPASTQLR